MLQAAPNPLASGIAPVRVGFTASRKVGNAVLRNRAKRRLRAAAAAVLARDGRQGTDYVLIARAGTGGRPYAQLLSDLEAALRQIDRHPLPSPPARAAEGTVAEVGSAGSRRTEGG